MSVQVKGSGTIGGLDEGLNIVGVVTATSFDGNITGTVGVGTDNPQSVLHLANANTTVWPFSESVSAGPAYTPYPHELVIDNDVSNVTGSFAGIYFNAGGYATTSNVSRVSTARIAAIDTGDYKADLAFSTRGFGNSNHKEHLRIKSDGKIGVGTHNPPEKLSIENGNIFIRDTSDNVSYIYFTHSPTADRRSYIGAVEGTGNSNSLVFATNGDGLDGAERARIDSDGRVLINSTTSRNIGANISRMLQIESSGGGAGIAVVRNSNNTSGPSLDLGKSRGYPNTIVQSGDKLGLISFSGADGNSLQVSGAQITGEVDGTPGQNDMPGRILFKTTADGASSPTERLRIDKDGYVTKPNLPYFYATRDPNITSNYLHSFVSVHGNNGSHYNNTTGRFTAPVSGFYWFSCGIWCNSASSNTSVLIQLQRYNAAAGSSTSFAGANHRTQYNSLNCSGGTYMAANDYVWIQQTGVSIQSSTPRNFFCGYLVG